MFLAAMISLAKSLRQLAKAFSHMSQALGHVTKGLSQRKEPDENGFSLRETTKRAYASDETYARFVFE